MNSGKAALKLGKVPREVVKDLEEYLKFVEMCTVKHNAEAGDPDLAFNFLRRNDVKLAYKKIVLSAVHSATIQENFPVFSRFELKTKPSKKSLSLSDQLPT